MHVCSPCGGKGEKLQGVQGRHTLPLAQEEMSLACPGTREKGGAGPSDVRQSGGGQKTWRSIQKVPGGLVNLFGRAILKRMHSLLGLEFCLISKETFLIFKKKNFKKRARNPQCLRFMFSKCGLLFLRVLDIFLMDYKYLKCVNTMGG